MQKYPLNKFIFSAFLVSLSPSISALDLGNLEVPSQDSVQSGIGIISGWKCSAGVLTAQFDDKPAQRIAYGTLRADTVPTCGIADTGFSLLINYNDLGDGIHKVRLYDNGVLFKETTFNVVTLGESFLRGATGSCTVPNFPHSGQQTTVTWQEAQQNFTITKVTNNGSGSGSGSGGSGGGVSETCGPNNFTMDRYNAIRVGMTLEQVTQTIGCPPSRLTVTLGEDFVLHRWTTSGQDPVKGMYFYQIDVSFKGGRAGDFYGGNISFKDRVGF